MVVATGAGLDRGVPLSHLTRAAAGCGALLALGLTGGCGGTAAPDAAKPETSPSSGARAADLPDDACSLVTAAQLGKAIGATVTTKTGPTGDCEFTQEDPRAASGSVGIVQYADTNGGYDGYLSGLGATMTRSRRHDVAGIGSRATVVTGVPSMGSGANLMAAGAADKETYLVVATLVQGQGDSEQQLTTSTTALLRALDTALG